MEDVTEQIVAWVDDRGSGIRFELNRFTGELRTYRLNGRPLQTVTCQLAEQKF
jgi:hypothetical protein